MRRRPKFIYRHCYKQVLIKQRSNGSSQEPVLSAAAATRYRKPRKTDGDRPPGPSPHNDCFDYGIGLNSTLLFSDLPAAVSLEAMGMEGP